MKSPSNQCGRFTTMKPPSEQNHQEQWQQASATETVAVEDADGIAERDALLLDGLQGEVMRLKESISDANGRYVSQEFGSTLRHVKAQLDDAVCRHWTNLELLLVAVSPLFDEVQSLLQRHPNSSVKLYMSAPQDATSGRSRMAIPNAVEIERKEWSNATFEEKQKELASQGVPATKQKNQFEMAVPTFQKCTKCLSDYHTTSVCSQQHYTCCTCGKLGHISDYCVFNKCAHCFLFGHSRRTCPTRKLPPACGKCGERDHFSKVCPNPNKLYCFLCGEAHRLHHCLKYLHTPHYKTCFPHHGAHLFENCPDKSH
uniref:CCHC-type domain-containing protein n=1 Tax=Panagrellus redivivus TaxID=6233 RepID=A0A7E4UP83_PANRE